MTDDDATHAGIWTFFEALREHGVPHSHLTSHPRVRDGLVGRKDVDIVIRQADANAAREALEAANFVRVPAPRWHHLPGVEDYFGLDDATGRLAHIQLHMQLRLRRLLGGRRVPWEGAIVEGARLDTDLGLMVPDPHVETVLLLAKAAAGDGDVADFARLRPRLDDAHWKATVANLLSHAPRVIAEELHQRDPAPTELAEIRRAVREAAAGDADAPGVLRMGEATWRRRARERFAWKVPSHRLVPRGLMVAVVGADGSGKSTLSRDLVEWISWKFDATHLYLGSGDGHSALYRRPLKWRRDRARYARSGSLPRIVPDGDTRRDQGASRLVRFERAAWATTLAMEKRAKVRRAARSARAGFIVVTDRYPQAQSPGALDGPLIQPAPDDGPTWLHHLGAWERGVYATAADVTPDLVLRLRVDVATALARKPDHDAAAVARRIDIVGSLIFPDGVDVVDVDATASQREVAAVARRHLWRHVADRFRQAAPEAAQ